MSIEKIEKEIQKIIADKTLNNIEKKVAIATALSGKYKGKNGEITVYRSPNNRTLLAIKGTFSGKNIHTIDLIPQKILGIIQNIEENRMIKLKPLFEEAVLFRVNYKDGTDDYVKMTTAERLKMPLGNVKNVTGLKWGEIPTGRKLVSYEEIRSKAKKKIGETKMKKSELRQIVKEELKSFIKEEQETFENKEDFYKQVKQSLNSVLPHWMNKTMNFGYKWSVIYDSPDTEIEIYYNLTDKTIKLLITFYQDEGSYEILKTPKSLNDLAKVVKYELEHRL